VRVARVAVPAVTQPVGRYPVLIEVDNPGADDTLELRIRPLGKGRRPDRNRQAQLHPRRAGVARPRGPKDGGLLFTHEVARLDQTA